jgi:hypothetical protein
MRGLAGLAVVAFFIGDAFAKDLPMARAYRQILDICLEETILNKQAHYHLAMAGRTMLVHCGCVADMAMSKLSPDEIPPVLKGEVPATAKSKWQEAHETCIKAGF